MVINGDKKRPAALNFAPSRMPSTESSSSTSPLKPPRTPRFAEATAVYSPVEPRANPFSEKSAMPRAQVSDVGFGYINDDLSRESEAVPTAPKSPLKSAMKVPGTARRFDNPMSPTFLEEQILEKRELDTDKTQAKDVRMKIRVRMAKFALRGVNFSCSLIVLSMMSSSFAIFDSTESLSEESNLPAWAETTGKTDWPQKVVLGASCLSLAMSIAVFIGYCRGGHRGGEKVSFYYTLFAIAWAVFSLVMWGFAAGVFQYSRNNSDDQDMWGWACKGDDNVRHNDFSSKVDYGLVCRLQSWGLVCAVVEILVEVITITLYGIIFYRYYTKRKLHKSMTMRDRARSDLYLAQLRVQSAPNTPGFGPKSPSFSQYALSPRFPPQAYRSLGDIDEAASPFTPGGKRLVVPESPFARQQQQPQEKPFKLQAPPNKANPATPRAPSFEYDATRTPAAPPAAPSATVNEHAPIAPGEQQYDAVPIPGAYAGAAVRHPGQAHMR